MNKSEIMNCAAILAAGVMANESGQMIYNAERAVELMFEIAGKLGKELDPEGAREYRQI